MHRFLTLLLWLAIAFAPVTAVAEDRQLTEDQEAHLLQLIDQGKKLYDSGEFAAARSKFRQAYEMYPHPDIIYRIALCHERLGEDQQAVQYYRRFLEEAPDAPERARVEKTIEVIEERISKSEIKVITDPDGAAVFINDEANGAAGYTPVGLAVKPGNYKVIIKKQGYEPVAELVTVQAGASVQVRYQLKPTSGSAGTPIRSTDTVEGRGAPPVLFVALVALGVGSGVTSYIMFANYSKSQSELDSRPKSEFTREQFRRLRRKANIQLGVGISAGAISLFSFVWAYGVLQSNRNARASRIDFGWSDGPVVGWSTSF